MTVSKQEPKNGDIFWCNEDKSHRKVTHEDMHDDFENKVVVYFDGKYLPLWEGMVKTFNSVS